jgi:hypothetical protein
VKSPFDSDDISAEQKRFMRRQARAQRAEAAEITARFRRILASTYRGALREKRDPPSRN